jgi:hypothetical protein
VAATLSQEDADEQLRATKESALREAFTWLESHRQEELFIEIEGKGRKFLLTLTRNPFEIKLHLRTKGGNVGLARIDNAAQHVNPDGSRVLGPHIHWYREGYDLSWAEPIGWYDTSREILNKSTISLSEA